MSITNSNKITPDSESNYTNSSSTNSSEYQNSHSSCVDMNIHHDNSNWGHLIENIEKNQELHDLSSDYYYKYYRVSHYSHFFLNQLIVILLITIIIIGNDDTSKGYDVVLYTAVSLQILNTFWTQIQSIIGFNKYDTLHNVFSRQYWTLMAEVELGGFDFRTIDKQYNLLKINAPNIPKHILKNDLKK